MTELKLELDHADVHADPYPTYHRLREESPVYWHEPWDRWLLSRYADVQEILRRSEDFRTTASISFVSEEQGTEFFRSFARWFVFQEPSEHRRLRGAMKKLFSRRMLQRYRPELEALADGLMDRHATTKAMEFSHDVAHPMSLRSILVLLSLPQEEMPLLAECIDTLSTAISKPLSRHVSARTEASYEILERILRDVIADRRRRRREDFVGQLVELLDDDHMIVAQCIVMLIGAYESTPNFLGSGLFTLLEHPSELQKLVEDRSLTGNAMEEMMRYESPVQIISRVATKDTEVNGHRFGCGEQITLLLGAANRDPAVFTEPDKFDVTRSNSRRHLAFGMGPHLCIGAPLARFEGEIVFSSLLERFPRVRPRDIAGVRWKSEGLRFRGVDALELVL
jgi:pimeloyl-[acyl-carrier protein] synthase